MRGKLQKVSFTVSVVNSDYKAQFNHLILMLIQTTFETYFFYSNLFLNAKLGIGTLFAQMKLDTNLSLRIALCI